MSRPHLPLYASLARLPLGYRAKILLVAFAGTHAPLLALVAWVAIGAVDWLEAAVWIGVALVATLAGALATLLVLDQLLLPVLLTGRALREYRERSRPCELPTEFDDEVGRLMADARRTIEQLDSTLRELRYVDGATGLANREGFELWLDHRQEGQRRFAVVVVRATRHEHWIRSVGKAVGDDALRRLADRLRNEPVLGAYLARVGPDMLAALVELGEQGAAAMLEPIRGSIERCDAPIDISGIPSPPGLVAGVSSWPDDNTGSGSLVDRAVSAAGEADAKQPVMVCSPQLRRSTLERFRVEHELRRAIDQDELELHYQPVIDLEAGRVVGAEALVRWRHPQRGLLFPGSFLGVAEASGLTDPMGRWVLRKACEQVRRWADEGHALRVAVNLSARQLGDPELVRLVRAAVDGARIAPDQLELELTETAAMADHARASAVFGRLRDDGVSIAIDDFGTGHSSLAWLRRLPFDKLKIDREFVNGVHEAAHNQAICDALIALGLGLGLRVLAEGTETAAEVEHLASRGCALFQGYWFSKPLPVEQFAGVVDRRWPAPATALRKRSFAP